MILIHFLTIAVDKANFTDVEHTRWDGVLGLKPSSSSGADLFAEVLKKQNLTDVAAFGVYFSSHFTGSKVTFGGIDPKRVPHFDNLTFNKLYDENSWSVGIRSMKYGDVEIGGQATSGVVDTGSYMLMLPTDDYNRWLTAIKDNKTCGTYSKYQGCFCEGVVNDEMFDPIYVTLDYYEYRIVPDEYIKRVDSEGKKFCYFLVGEIKDSGATIAALGDTFIRNYYVYYDMENKRIGLYGDYMVHHEPVMSSPNPTSSKDHNVSIKMGVIASILIVCVLLC